MKIRAAQERDIPVLLVFEQQVIEAEKPFNKAIKNQAAHYYDLPGLIQDPNALLLVAQIGDEMVACGYAWIKKSKQALNHDQHTYLGFMYTVEKYRGKGIIRQVIDELKTWSLDQGVTDFYLDVYVGNQSAIKAYEKCGFEPSLVEMKLHI